MDDEDGGKATGNDTVIMEDNVVKDGQSDDESNHLLQTSFKLEKSSTTHSVDVAVGAGVNNISKTILKNGSRLSFRAQPSVRYSVNSFHRGESTLASSIEWLKHRKATFKDLISSTAQASETIERTIFGAIWIAFHTKRRVTFLGSFLSFLSCIVYLVDDAFRTQRNNDLERDSRISWIFFVLYFTLTVYWSVEYFMLLVENRWYRGYVLSFVGIIDFVTSLPSLMLCFLVLAWQLWERESSPSIELIRVLATVRVFQLIRLQFLFSSDRGKKGFEFGLHLFGILFTFTAALCALESFEFFETSYFAIISVTTVGYGDIEAQSNWGRLLVIILVLTTMIFIPMNSNHIVAPADGLVSKANSRSKVEKHLHDSNHVVMVGTIESGALPFFDEFFHPDHNLEYKSKILVVSNNPGTSMAINLCLLNRQRAALLSYMHGAPYSKRSLDQSGIRKARIVYIMSESASCMQEEDDRQTLLSCVGIFNYLESLRVTGNGSHFYQSYQSSSVSSKYSGNTNNPKKQACEKLRLYVKILLSKNKRLLQHFVSDGGRYAALSLQLGVVCPEEIKYKVQARSCVMPGFATFISNLFISNISRAVDNGIDEIINPENTAFTTWEQEYATGALYSIYRVPLESTCRGLKFSDFSKIVYHEIGALVVGLGLKFPSSDNEEIYLNPSDFVIPCPSKLGVFALVIALDRVEAEMINIRMPGASSKKTFNSSVGSRAFKNSKRKAAGRRRDSLRIGGTSDDLEGGMPGPDRDPITTTTTNVGNDPETKMTDLRLTRGNATKGGDAKLFSPIQLENLAKKRATLSGMKSRARLGASTKNVLNQSQRLLNSSKRFLSGISKRKLTKNGGSRFGKSRGKFSLFGSRTYKAGGTPQEEKANLIPLIRRTKLAYRGRFQMNEKNGFFIDTTRSSSGSTGGGNENDSILFVDEFEADDEKDPLFTIFRMNPRYLRDCYFFEKEPRSLDVAFVKESVPKNVPNMRDHVIIYAPNLSGIAEFLLQIRSKSTGGIIPVVIITEQDEIGDNSWASISYFPQVYIILGRADAGITWRRAGISNAARVALTTSHLVETDNKTTNHANGRKDVQGSDDDKDEENVDSSSLNSSGNPSRNMSQKLDAKMLVVYNTVLRENRHIPVCCELMKKENIGLLQNRVSGQQHSHHHHHDGNGHHHEHSRSRRGSFSGKPVNVHDDVLLTAIHASGTTFPTELYDVLLAQAYYNPFLCICLERFLSGPMPTRKTGFLRRKYHLKDSDFITIHVNDRMAKCTFGDVFNLLCDQGILPVFLRRGIQQKTKLGIMGNRMPYIITNPERRAHLYITDSIYCLSVHHDGKTEVEIPELNIHIKKNGSAPKVSPLRKRPSSKSMDLSELMKEMMNVEKRRTTLLSSSDIERNQIETFREEFMQKIGTIKATFQEINRHLDGKLQQSEEEECKRVS